MEIAQSNISIRRWKVLFHRNSHKWMYDSKSLVYHCRNAGFSNVKRCNFRESLIDDIEIIEQPERVLNGGGICVEGTK